MNASRVAKALRELADALEAPADESAAPQPAESSTVPVADAVATKPISEFEKQRARKALRRLGVAT